MCEGHMLSVPIVNMVLFLQKAIMMSDYRQVMVVIDV